MSAEGRLSGKVALISGTGGGQGRVAALMFTREGARVVGCDVDEAAAAETQRLVAEAGGEYVSLAPLDLSERAGADSWVGAAKEAFGGVDILYNNASRGSGRSGPCPTRTGPSRCATSSTSSGTPARQRGRT
jgi:meso-butanediol dehydrogenase/(S,S)-butanediol dehydrogenase/diacetyl reductase